jgi:hypothetical protein
MSIHDRVLWLSRRAFLGGSGTLVALPFLDSLAPRRARAASAAAPKRFLAWYWACGIPSITDWKPAGNGVNWQPSMLLTPIMPVKNKVTVLSGLRNAGHGPDHTYGTGAFLTGSNLTAAEKINQSIDQVIADSLQAGPGKPPIHSLQLGPLDTNCEPQGHCGFLQNISFGATGTPITKETDAQNAFNRLFMGGGAPAASDSAAKARQALRKSVLDAVNTDAKNLSGLLGKDDKARFDEYLTSVRKVEDQVGAVGGGGTGMLCSGTKLPTGLTTTEKPAANLEAQIDAFTSVMTLAFQCDMTRVISFMMTAGGTKYAPMGYTDYHLGITHHSVSDWQPKFRTVVTWIVLKLTQFLQKLDAIKEADGSSILDNTVVFASSEISDGNRHNHDDMPVILGGGLGGIIKPGQHLQFTKGETFADLFMWIARSMGVPPLTKFGETGTGKISEL